MVQSSSIDARKDQIIKNLGYLPKLPLTPREFDLIKCAAAGLTAKETGRELAISPRTAEIHYRNIREKFGVPNMTAAVAKAIREGIIE